MQSKPASRPNALAGIWYFAVWAAVIGGPLAINSQVLGPTRDKVLGFITSLLISSNTDVLYVLVIALGLLLFWLKLVSKGLYGSLEVFIALLTVLMALSTIRRPDSYLVGFLQLFGGLYILVRGLDNIQASENIELRKFLDLNNVTQYMAPVGSLYFIGISLIWVCPLEWYYKFILFFILLSVLSVLKAVLSAKG